jgi:hypothetical protein
MLALTLLELTLHEILADIPHDAGALVAYSFIALFLGFTLAGSRRSRREPGP